MCTRKCSTCPFNKYAVMKHLPKKVNADIVVVEGMVSTTELASDYFTGNKGNVVKGAMKKAKLPLSKTYFTSMIKCRPPIDDVTKAIDTCRESTMQEIYDARPKMIIALGWMALYGLMGETVKFSHVVNTVVYSKDLPDIPIFVIDSPISILKNGGLFKDYVQAFKNANYLYRAGKPKHPGVVEFKVIKDFFGAEGDEVRNVFEKLNNSNGELGADIETGGLEWWRSDILTIGVSYAKNKAFVFDGCNKDVINFLFDTYPKVKWVWQGGKFDGNWLKSRGVKSRLDYDTLLESYAINENSPNDLEYLATLWLGAEPYKSKANKYIKSDDGFSSAPKEVQWERVAVDADYTLQLHKVLYKQVCDNPRLKWLYHNLLLPASDLLEYIQFNGMWTNSEVIDELEKILKAEKEELLEELRIATKDIWDPVQYKRDTGAKSASEEFKYGSPKQIAWLLYDKLGLKPKNLKGRSTDKDTLETIRDQSKVVDLILKLRGNNKELSTYVIGLKKARDDEGRVHSTLSLHTTATGRLSSKKPNMQNVPKKKKHIRNIIQAPDGRIFIEADYKSAELRVMALLSQSVNMKNIFINRRDLHTETATAMGVERRKAKSVNFGIPYGETAYGLSRSLGISKAEAQKLIDAWALAYPNVFRFLKSCATKVRYGKALVTQFGRYRRFGVVTERTRSDVDKQAKNFKIQSVASDLTLLSAIRLYRQLAQFDAKIIVLVHDSILIEAPNDKETIKKIARLLNDTMVETPLLYLKSDVPFAVDVTVGTSWAYQTKIMDYGEWGVEDEDENWTVTEDIQLEGVA